MKLFKQCSNPLKSDAESLLSKFISENGYLWSSDMFKCQTAFAT